MFTFSLKKLQFTLSIILFLFLSNWYLLAVAASKSAPANSFGESPIQNPSVSSAGTYTLTVTNPVNGCMSTDTAIVVQDITLPGATASGGTITCANASVTLGGSSSTSGVTYSWSGPNSFTSTLQNPSVRTTGKYILTVTSVVVEIDTLKPASVKAAVSNTLTCSVNSATLSGSTVTGNVTFSWRAELYSNKDSLVKVLFDKQVEQSQIYQVTVDGTIMTAGTYYVLVRSANKKEVYTLKSILIK
jgi:hypothetical protein